MALSLSKKLMLAFIGVTLVVLVATLSLARWSFERGFLDYTNAVEQQRLTQVSNRLSSLYISQGKRWDNIHRRVIERQYLSEHTQPPPRMNGRPPRGDDMPPPGSLERMPPPPRAPGTPPTALLAPNGQLIAGSLPDAPSEEWVQIPVTAEGQVVALLVTAPKRHLATPLASEFSQKQWLTSLVIGLFSLVLAVLASLVLIRVLLAPIRRMILHVSHISSGDYKARLNESRKDELGQLMADLDRMAQTLDKNQSARQRWFADISHELRTPVTVLTGELSALQDGIRPLNLAQVTSLSQEVERLKHLIDDLYQLSVSDLGGLRYHFEPLDLSEVLQQSLLQAKSKAERKTLKLNCPSSPSSWVQGDKQRLLQLFSNLLSNSLAYTDAPGEIEVKLSPMESHVELTISDTPPGVTEEECSQLFEPLYRQEASRSRRTAGAGLGLAICRNIIEAHQGQISALPSSLGGLSIKVTLPLYREPNS